MTDALATALIVATPPTLIALTGLIVAIKGGQKSDRNNQGIKEVKNAVEGGVATVNQIHEQTNGGMTVQKKALAVATASLAANTGNPTDRQEAMAAKQDYENHLAETKKPSKP